MTAPIALEAIETGTADLPRKQRDVRRNRKPVAGKALVPAPHGSTAEPLEVTPPAALPTAAFATGLISRQAPPPDVLLERRRLLDAGPPLPERGDLPLRDRLV